MADLYVSADLEVVEVGEGERVRGDLVQTDADGRRVYRKCDGLWWRWLSHVYRGTGRLMALRARIVAVHGESAVAKAESKEPVNTYQIPRLL